MILWFQKTFGKHYKWALITALVVLCLSTIVGIGAVPRGALTARANTERMYLGLNLNDPQATQDVINAMQFTNQSLSGNPVSDDTELQLLMDERLALTQLANQWQIPDATQKQIADYLQGLNKFKDAEGNFSPIVYTSFSDSIQAAEPAKRELALRTIKENARLERVREILGGPGYVLPDLPRATAGLNDLKVNLDTATLDFNKFEPTTVDVKDDVLQAIFQKYPDQFKKPAEAKLSYAMFPAASTGTPTAGQLHDYAVAHKDAFPDLDPNKMSDKDKGAVTEAWQSDQEAQAEKDAGDTATKFAREFLDLKIERTSPDFAALLKKYHVTVQSLPLLVQGTPAPANSPIPDDLLQQMAFDELTPQQPITTAQVANGTAVLFLDEATPARVQTFAEARDAVKAAYLQQQKAVQFTAHGQAVHDAIVKAMAEGKSFTEAAAAQGLSVKNYPEVSPETIQDTLMSMSFDPTAKAATSGPLASMGRDILMVLTQPTANQGPPLLMTLQPNQVSPMVPANGEGVIFHVVNRVVPTEAADSPDVKRVDEALKAQEANGGAMLYLQRVIQDARDSVKPTDSSQG